MSAAAKKLLSETATALREAHGYVMRGTITEGSQPLRLTTSTTSSGSVAIAMAGGPSSVQLLFIKHSAYVRANEHVWRSQAMTRGRARSLADRWIAVPGNRADALASSLGVLGPATLARCLVEDHGSLSIFTGRRVAGRPTVVLKDAGNAPGASPESLIIAAHAPHYPLRLTSSGNTRPGGRIDVCNDGKGSSARGTISFSHFGTVRPIRAPLHPLHLSGWAGQLQI